MAKLRIREQIFSIVNHPSYKQITVLGIPVYRKYFSTEKDIEFYKNIPVKNNKIVFMNYLGKSYGCNPKYIIEEIIRRDLPYELVWGVKGNIEELKKDFPSRVKLVDFNSKDFLKELASAKIWAVNHHFVKQFALGLRKKDSQYYIQTWHGSLGIKKIEKNVSGLTSDEDWENFAIKNSQAVDLWLSNSSFETDVYKTAFWDVKNIKEYGHPRNDIFFKSEDELKNIKQKVYRELNIPSEKKLLFHAPSFSENRQLSAYKLQTPKILAELQKTFGGEWVLASRVHPSFCKRLVNKFTLQNGAISANEYPDIQELLVASDAMITDYSSSVFDFMLSRKPAFIFAPDLKSYNKERGFYYPIESTPFPISKNNIGLIKNIQNFNIEEYKLNCNNFLSDKGCIENGQAAAKVVDEIEKIISEVQND